MQFTRLKLSVALLTKISLAEIYLILFKIAVLVQNLVQYLVQ